MFVCFYAVPAAPTGLRNESIYRDSLTVAWDYDTTWSGSDKVKYVVAYKEQGGEETTVETSLKEMRIENLKNSTMYEVRVAVSESRNGTGVYSAAINIATNEGKILWIIF